MNRWTALALGSLAGGFARYGLAGTVYGRLGTSFPWGTLAVNLSGCFLIGVLHALAEEKFALGPETRLLLMTGFCGAFTTFSTLILETDQLLQGGQPLRATANLGASVLAGLLLFRLGAALGRIA